MNKRKLLLIIIDGVPYNNWRRLFGNLEGWVKSGDARVWKMRSVLPSTSGPCYASIHTGVTPQEHGVTSNHTLFRVQKPDIFSQVRSENRVTAGVAHSFWSNFFNRHPFDVVRDVEFDEPENPTINHGRFHSMTGYSLINQMTPSDVDLFGSLTNLCQRFGVDYGILHTCTLDCMGHRFQHESHEMDHACFAMDAMLAPFIPQWRDAGYEVIVTADHGQDARGHHGGSSEQQQDFALYYFGDDEGPAQNTLLDQLSLAPSILTRMGVPVPDTMKAKSFFSN